MKPFKISFLFIGFLISWAWAMPAQALTPITGTAYGESIGLIHLDYATAYRPTDYSGPQRDYYASPWSENFQGPRLAAFAAQIYDLGDEERLDNENLCDLESCYLSGYSWSDTIGWILIEGLTLQEELGEADFPETLFAKIHTSGALTGYLWSEYTGWIQLASDADGTRTPAGSQTLLDWGVFMDPASEPVIVENPDEDEDDIELGRELEGYAWSQNLGWIKWGQEPGDGLAFGAFTRWVPDTTSPEVFAVNEAWFANDHPPDQLPGMITWRDFAFDPESGIRDVSFTVVPDPGDDFEACDEPSAGITHGFVNGYLYLEIPSVGQLLNTRLGYCKYLLRGTITNPAGLSVTWDEENTLTFYVRAGRVNTDRSSIIPPVTSSSVADGTSPLIYEVNLADIDGNPIREVDCFDCPQRQVTVTGTFSNSMRFDTILNSPDTYPVQVNGSALGTIGPAVLAPAEGVRFDSATEHYPFSVTSFAPTTSLNSLELAGVSIEIVDDLLPAVSSRLRETAGETSRPTLTLGGAAPQFEPALVALSGQVTTGALQNQVVNGLPATLSYQLQNLSPTSTLSDVNYDTIFEYPGAALVRTEAIDHESRPDEFLGWLAPVPPLAGAHYELFSGSSFAGNASNAIFQRVYPLLKEVGVPSPLLPGGEYAISGVYDIPEEREDDEEGWIDRSDEISLTLGPRGSSVPQLINFTPAFLLLPPEMDLSDINLRVHQQMAYRFEGQPALTIYEPEEDLVAGVDVETAGVDYKGLGAGETIFNGQLQVIGPRGLRGLEEQIRRNAASLTLNLESCSSATPLETAGEAAGELTLKLDNPGDPCIKLDDKNKTVVAFYSGSLSEILTLGDGSSPILIPPDYKYTLILKGGMNLFIQSNLAFSDDVSSFGMIVLSENGEGGNVYLAPGPTNIVGQLYSEGSLISSPDPLSGRFYYGTTENPQDLKNQLYWQGSIASLNTIGGAGNNIVPKGIETSLRCPGITLYQCAQRYDMNFLRRFSPGNDGLFSGGGSCSDTGCSFPGPLELPTAITITGGVINQTASLSVDALFIEPSTDRPSPPGFSVTEEQKSSGVIRN